MEQKLTTSSSSNPFLLQVGLHSWLPILPILFIALQLIFLFTGGIPDRPYYDLVVHRLMWVVCCVGLMWFALEVIRAATNRMSIFSDRLEIYTGLWGKTIKSIPLAEIAQVKSRFLGSSSAGSLLIQTKTGELVTFGIMASPLKTEQFLTSLLSSVISS